MNGRISLIEQVITEASKSFINGHENNKAFRKKTEGDLTLKEKLKGWPFLSFKDKRFKSDANLIPGTHFVASAGPRGVPEMRDFIDDTAYNEKFPIKQILNLGDCTAYHRDDHQDFHDYCLKERTARFGRYFFTVTRIKGETRSTVSGHQTFPKTMVQSRVTICRILPEDSSEHSEAVVALSANAVKSSKDAHVLNVTTLELPDQQAIDLNKDSKDELKEALWQIYQTSRNEPVLIHCAGGVGRTGHMILMFELLKHHDKIFVSNDPQIIAHEIQKVLERIRQVRPALVTADSQFACSIRNAHILHKYALKMKYIQKTGYPSSLGMFSNPELPQVFVPTDYIERCQTPGNKNFLL